MNKFTKQISASSNKTLARRAATLSQAVEVAANSLINDLKAQKSQIELTLADLMDFAPDTTDSLRVGTKDFDAKEWINKVQEQKEMLYDVTISLQLAEETYKELFTEED